MSRPPARIIRGEFLREWSRKCDWSKDTLQGWVVDGLAAWGQDPTLAPFFAGVDMSVAKNQRIKMLDEWCCALPVALACAPQASADRDHEFTLGRVLTLTLHQSCLEGAVPLPPVMLSQDVLLHWAQRINTSCLLTGISQDLTKISIFIPFVFPDQSATIILGALKTCASEVCTILSAFSKYPDVARAWVTWVEKSLGDGAS